MKRREFMSLFGKGATAGAATMLVGIPEAKPKIHLLEEKKIITDFPDVDFIIDSVTSIDYSLDSNLQLHPILGTTDVNYHLGREDIYVNVELYSGEKGANRGLYEAIKLNNKLNTFTFDFPLILINGQNSNLMELNGLKFLLRSFEVHNSVGTFTTVSLRGVKIAQ